jgi:hypothetical protein
MPCHISYEAQKGPVKRILAKNYNFETIFIKETSQKFEIQLLKKNEEGRGSGTHAGTGTKKHLEFSLLTKTA